MTILGFVLVVLVGSASAAQGPSWTDDGDIVGSFCGSAGAWDFHGFALIDGQYTTIDVPGAFYTETYRINDEGTIVGGYADASRRSHGYIGVRNP